MISPDSRQIRYLRQDISITGLGLEEFQDQVNSIPDITALFTRAVREDKIQPITMIGEQEGFTTLNASNRYFTARKEAQTAKELPFHQDIDPKGNLAKLIGTQFVHLEENNVSYYERVSSHAGDTRNFTLMFFLSLILTQVISGIYQRNQHVYT